MSDTSQGEGWWQASDNKWYPPQPIGAPPPPGTPPPPAKKKRGCLWWIIGVLVLVVVIVIIAVAASGGSDDSAKTSGGSSSSVSKGLGSKEASADVKGLTLIPPDSIGVSYVQATITNNSEGRSNYIITTNVESPDGKTKYADTTIIAQNVEPGQTTTEKGIVTTTDPIPADAVVKLTEVQRNASP